MTMDALFTADRAVSLGERSADVEQFKAMVLKHIADRLPESEWQRFRTMSTNRARASLRGVEPQPQASPVELVSMAMSQDGMTLAETLPPPFMRLAVEIGMVACQPVFYVSGEGIYVWARDPEMRPVLSVWLTHPAYPPNW